MGKQEIGNDSRIQKRKRKQNSLLILFCFLCILVVGSLLYRHNTNNLAPPVSSETTVDESKWRLILVNKWHAIPANYQVDLIGLSNGESVDKRIYPQLQKMFDDARASDIDLEVTSGYRTTATQQKILDDKINAYINEGNSKVVAKIKAAEWVAIPGTSEHQLGISADINAKGSNQASDAVYQWLAQNAYKYGFIHRFPADKKDITGVSNEPWHYRYVGIKAATEIQKQNICLEEYLDQIN